MRHYAQHRRISHVARASPPALQSTFSPSSMPTVSLDVTSLVASSCVCYGGHIEQRAAHEFAVHVAIQRRARETSTAPSSAARVARCARAGASLPTSTADPQVVALILGTLSLSGTPRWRTWEEQRPHRLTMPHEAMPARLSSFRLLDMASPYWMLVRSSDMTVPWRNHERGDSRCRYATSFLPQYHCPGLLPLDMRMTIA